ncbi:hypothetical protein L7F22_036943 [Adiantum nelumboides]|nr:hypothetical protein [Adiantum nelumboides]
MAVMAGSGMALNTLPSMVVTTRVDCKTSRRAVSLGRKMNSFTGMKSESRVSRIGLSESTEAHFARAVLAHARSAAGSRGGAATSTCNIGDEIFRVVPIMSGLVLVGIALGFVLLRVEAALEESE